MKKTFKPKTLEMIKREPEIEEYFVWWDDITQDKVDGFRNKIDLATDEPEMQKFFEENPIYLIQHLGGGHGRWVIPQKRLGSEFTTDFVIGESHSFGYDWIAVELESPKAKMFNKNGDLKHLQTF